MNSTIEQRNRFAKIGLLMAIISLIFLLYIGSSLVSSTKNYLRQIQVTEVNDDSILTMEESM